MKSEKKKCSDCANKKTDYCLICTDDDMHMTEEEKEISDWMCDMLCGSLENESD